MRIVFLIGLAVGSVAGHAHAQNIPTNRNVALKVGQSTIIHGARGNACGAPAPSWAEVAPTLPASSIGTVSDGGVGTRGSRSCGGNVPARAIRYKAIKKGAEVVTIQGDPISITVQ
jgi:hypothetical protein